MKAWLLSINNRKRHTAAAIIVMIFISVSLVTTGITSALCDLSAFVILAITLWLKIGIES